MMKVERYHPLLILFELWKLVRNSIFFVVYLFIIKGNSDSNFVTYGQFIFIVIFGLALVSIVLKWLSHKYKLEGRAFHLYKGIFSKSERTIPFSKIQNVNRHTSIFHRIFKVTSISFETGINGDEAVTFDVISKLEADRIEELIKVDDDQISTKPIQEDDISAAFNVDASNSKPKRRIHFKPTNRDIFKASITSLSILALIPLMVSLYFKLDDIYPIEERVEGMFSAIQSSWWIVMLVIIVLVVSSVIFGVVRTFLQYGQYEISSDLERIYVRKGVIEENHFSIAKDKVQAIEIKQSLMKRMLGLAEVKLISAGHSNADEDKTEISSLYPFLPINRAYEMVAEILPSFQVTNVMNRLPRKSLWLRICQPSWFWIIITALLFYFKPSILSMEQAWWIISAILFIIIYVLRWLDFVHTRYSLNGSFIQIKTGSVTTSLFISKRNKVIGVKVTRNLLQKLLGLANIGIVCRAKPVLRAGVEDVPLAFTEILYQWYKRRREEIEVK
ncbi:PH domain-containing protein [Lederbergia galactosidilytica]|uniref:Membrane protein n=1 Tax=Lederbergia galactosidilytica TaxID=217031 RepID=A0A178A4G6_9BACI|nr:PH domain-containing protein [Lederbergia galactosidilytica]MBP1913951.1 putative membrane protein [Lederbergia galactosidilytica]OAK73988.1 membrane protein [Lederbergia galactosidilytica]